MTEDEMVGWHHQLNGHEFGQTLGIGDGQGGLAYCSSWGRKEDTGTRLSDWTELKANPCNSNYLKYFIIASFNPSSKTLGFV